MRIWIAQWDKWKNRIADELYDKPFDWLSNKERLHTIAIFKSRLKEG